jgi:hypothetical protein
MMILLLLLPERKINRGALPTKYVYKVTVFALTTFEDAVVNHMLIKISSTFTKNYSKTQKRML